MKPFEKVGDKMSKQAWALAVPNLSQATIWGGLENFIYAL